MGLPPEEAGPQQPPGDGNWLWDGIFGRWVRRRVVPASGRYLVPDQEQPTAAQTEHAWTAARLIPDSSTYHAPPPAPRRLKALRRAPPPPVAHVEPANPGLQEAGVSSQVAFQWVAGHGQVAKKTTSIAAELRTRNRLHNIVERCRRTHEVQYVYELSEEEPDDELEPEAEPEVGHGFATTVGVRKVARKWKKKHRARAPTEGEMQWAATSLVQGIWRGRIQRCVATGQSSVRLACACAWRRQRQGTGDEGRAGKRQRAEREEERGGQRQAEQRWEGDRPKLHSCPSGVQGPTSIVDREPAVAGVNSIHLRSHDDSVSGSCFGVMMLWHGEHGRWHVAGGSGLGS